MIGVNTIHMTAPLRWLARGWKDLLAAPAPSLIYGMAVAAVSSALWRALITSDLAFWALSLSCGFVFIAPVLAMGLYEAGRRLGNGEQPTLRQMLAVRGALRPDIFYLGLALVLIYLFWGRLAQIVYGLSTYRLHTTAAEFIAFARDTPEGHAMLISGTIVGGALAMFTFAITVVSMPMLLDQKANVFEAMFTSIRSVARNFFPMLFWAALITVLLIASAATAWLGLVVVFPWLGLASWRAYRDVVSENAGINAGR